ncbi:hypothetical protein PR003_g9014 [Phytophthora rubi]|uniref:RxLR effector protein n=1 Tax=Phytophthora rubi TaxID=129364 RepID=A0A6A4F9H7_9STRA|nr:hypothetical protein PR003_g9014 [Phytophthora rubi]
MNLTKIIAHLAVIAAAMGSLTEAGNINQHASQSRISDDDAFTKPEGPTPATAAPIVTPVPTTAGPIAPEAPSATPFAAPVHAAATPAPTPCATPAPTTNSATGNATPSPTTPSSEDAKQSKASNKTPGAKTSVASGSDDKGSLAPGGKSPKIEHGGEERTANGGDVNTSANTTGVGAGAGAGVGGGATGGVGASYIEAWGVWGRAARTRVSRPPQFGRMEATWLPQPPYVCFILVSLC